MSWPKNAERLENPLLFLIAAGSLVGLVWSVEAFPGLEPMSPPARFAPDLSGREVRIAVPIWRDAEETKSRYGRLLAYMSETTPFRFRLRAEPSSAAVSERFEGGEAEAAFLGPCCFLEARDRIGAIPILQAMERGGAVRESVAASFLGKGLRVLAFSDPIPTMILCISPGGDWERRLIAWALEQENGNKSGAARRLSIPRTTLLDRMSRLGMDADS